MNTHGPQLYQGSPGSENVLSAGPQVTRVAEGQAPLLEMNPLELTEVTPPLHRFLQGTNIHVWLESFMQPT